MLYDIWMEGYLATGMEGIPAEARLMECVVADTFQEACDTHFKNDVLYNSEQLSYWGCCLFDNETDARKMFG